MDEVLGILVAEFGGTEQHDTRLVEGYRRTTIREIGIVLAEESRGARHIETIRIVLQVCLLGIK